MISVHDLEKQVQEFWRKNRIPHKAKELNKNGEKFYFLDGPPYATGYIHIGTAWNKILKDAYIRFWRMKGFNVWNQPGYDTHGLPIENKVEQKLGFHSKADIERLGIEKFNKECRAYVEQFFGIMNKQFEDLGVWMDWDNPYITFTNDYIEGAWHTFKTGFEKGLLYKDVYSVHVCPHCVDPESRILVEGGTRKIKELAHCWQHNKVVSVNINSKELVTTNPLGYLDHEEDAFIVRTKTGKKLIASLDHPFWTEQGWKQLSKLKLGVKVAVYNNVESGLPEMSERGRLIINESKIKTVLENLENLNPGFSALNQFNNLTSNLKNTVKNSVYKLKSKGYSYSKIIKYIDEKHKIKVSKSWIAKILKTKTLTRFDILIKKLKEKELIPLYSKSVKALILARLLGHILGDGSLIIKKVESRKFPMFTLVFTGKEEDLKEIQKDLDTLGYEYSSISKRVSKSIVNNRVIMGITTSMRCNSSSLAVLLVSLGAPIGRKTNTLTVVPKCIESNKKIIREFLAAYFGSELDIIKTRRYGKGFDALRLHITKNRDFEKNGIEFAEKIRSLIKIFGVTTSQIRIDRKKVNNKEKSKITISIDANDENLIRFTKFLGYEYCKERKTKTAYALGYLLFKKRKKEEMNKLKNKILSLRNFGIPCSKIALKLNVSELYVRHVVYGKSKSTRAAKYILPFGKWLKIVGKELKDGLIWEEIEKIKYLGKRKVCDIAVEKHNNFLTNGFLTHNCETAVAYNEIEYTQVKDPSVYIKFPVKGKTNEYLLIWTTTPWTLPSNTGIMAKPDTDYVFAKINGETLIMTKVLLESVMNKAKKQRYEIVKTVKGKDLNGIKYTQPLSDVFPFINKLQNAHRVVLSDQYVSLEEGTGLVHTAPGHGQEDYKVGKEQGLPVVSPLKMNGTYNEECGKFAGKLAKSADDEIITEFKNRGLLFYQEKITHDYPQCWRCSSPLLFMAVPQWFFRVTSIRDKLKKENEKVKWHPDWAGKRFDNWLDSLGDWPISRQRYWGIPLPIWECEKCNSVKVIESRKELPKVPKDFHRPYIDEVTIACRCGGTMKRIPDVLDVWFDAGLASWASLGYPEKKDLFEKLWPSDLQIEGPDQIRGWWNAELITSVITFDKAPFKKILFHGFVLDAHGVKMSKSKGNIIEPADVVNKYGRDVLRFYLLSSPAWDDFYFNWTDTDNVSKTFNILRNTFQFVKTYVNRIPKDVPKLNVEDKWLLSRLNSMVQDYHKEFMEANHHKVVERLNDFVLNDFSRWYIKLVRDRTWPTYTGKDKDAAFYTLVKVSETLLKLLAPLTPYIAEYIYQDVVRPMTKGKDSIHLYSLPEIDAKVVDKKLEEQMKLVKAVVEETSSVRQKENIRLRWPVKRLIVVSHDEKTIGAVGTLEKVLENMCNVKSVEIASKLPKGKFAEGNIGDEKLYLDIEVDQELYEERLFRELVRTIQELRKKNKFVVTDEINLSLKSNEDIEKVLKKFGKNLEKEIGAVATVVGKLEGKYKGELNFEGGSIEIAFSKK